MIQFRTEVGMPKIDKTLSYRKNAMMVGSCFTENIGNYLQKHGFPILTNPCGILYNPASIATCIDILIVKQQLKSSDLFLANDLWNNFNFHSRFSHSDPETALERMNGSLATASRQLQSASHLFITFGTAWIYRNIDTGAIVGNCHKLPAGQFSRERLTVEEMTDLWIMLLQRLFEFSPNIHIVLTISPIRHMKDGSFENQISKSALFLLVDNLLTHFATRRINYFPSYELMMDELRDYRFYAGDMLHLSETAIAFIQEKFNDLFLDDEGKQIINRIDKIIKSLDHKPFQINNSTYTLFLAKLEEQLFSIRNQYPGLVLNDLIIDITHKKG